MRGDAGMPEPGRVRTTEALRADGVDEIYSSDLGVTSYAPIHATTFPSAAVRVLLPACRDRYDNDGDGRIDAPGDPGCTSGDDESEIGSTYVCDDGLDNDGDGKVDYRVLAGVGDPGCREPGGNLERPQCQDGLNNDGQTGIDFDGGASLDLDHNGFVDAAFNPATPAVGAADPQCVGKPWSNKERAGCGLGFEVALIAPLLARLRRRKGRRRRTQRWSRVRTFALVPFALCKGGRDMAFQTELESRARRGAELVAVLVLSTLGFAWALGGSRPAAAACAHSVCSSGSALPFPAAGTLGCSPCVSTVCDADPFCCTSAWDNICVGEVKTVCGSDECSPGAIVIDAFDGGLMGLFSGGTVSTTGSMSVTENTHSVPPPTTNLRQWNKFDLTGVTQTIASVQLQLEFPPGAYGSSSPWVDLTLWDVTSSPDSFGFDFAAGFERAYSASVFEDLGGGTSYGVRYYSAADEGTLTVMPLNASGVAQVSAARGGVFAVGGSGPYYACLPPCSPVPTQFIFLNTGALRVDPRFGLPPEMRARRLVLVPPECSNGADDDLDGLTDHPADTGCTDGLDLSERDPSKACDDGADNDGDGKHDYFAAGGGDPGCYNARSGRENPQCQDGLDNDNAAGIDFDGGASLDLDHNGFVDAAFNPATPAVGASDPQCVGKPWSNKERSGCGLGFEIVLLAPLLTRIASRRRS